MKNISVAILTKDNLKGLGALVDNIEATSSCVGEIIVVDNGSAEEVRRWLVDNMSRLDPIMRVDDTFKELAFNFGFAEATGKYIVQMRDDIILLPNWDQFMLECFNVPLSEEDVKKGRKIGAVGEGWILNKDWLQDLSPTKALPHQLCDVLDGGCWMFLREEKGIAWEYSTLFALEGGIEWDLQLRMRAAAGYKFVSTPKVFSSTRDYYSLTIPNLQRLRSKWKGKPEILHLEIENLKGESQNGHLDN